MKKMPYILIGLIAFGLIVYFFFKQKNKPETQDYLISTQKESEERTKNLDLNKASKNASHILDIKKLSFPKANEEAKDEECKPDTEKDWIINIKTLNPISFTTDQLFKIFDKEWRVNFGAADVHGYSVKEKKWTYAIVGGDPDIYSKIQVAIDLVEIYAGENPTYGTKKMKNTLQN